MNMKDLVRDPSKVHVHLKELEDGSVITTKGCTLVCPARFRDKKLVSIDSDVYVLGIFMIVVEGRYYAVSSTNAMMRIDPSTMNDIYIDGVPHLEFVFEPGSIVIANTNLIVDGNILFYIFEELISRGNVPVFFGYDDLINLFETSIKHAGVRLSSTPTILHMLLSMVARNPDDLNQFYRQIVDGTNTDKVKYIALHSTTHGANNTTARLLGAHFSDNLTSALVNPSDREENIETILRM
jgi:hypothetical protein